MPKKNNPRPKASLFIWHRYLGLIVGLFVIILSVTGILLNHTEALHLDEKRVSQPWVLDMYGISEAKTGAAWEVNGHWISSVDKEIYLDAKPLDGLTAQSLKGSVSFMEMLLISAGDRLALYTPQGDLVDTLSNSHFINDGIDSVALTDDGRPIIQSGKRNFSVNEDFTEMIPLDELPDNTTINQPKPLPDHIQNEISETYLGDGLPLERVVLDLHSGRIIGKVGVFLMDSAAVLMILLTLTGKVIWGRRILRRGRQKVEQSEQ